VLSSTRATDHGARIEFLERTAAHVRWSAAVTLGWLGVKERDVVEALVARLEDEDVDMQLGALKVLEQLCPLSRDAIEMLRALAEDEGKDRDARYLAARVLVVAEENRG
jgi:HEAT repeat protein